ncbi:hypothetical protein BDK51DRAFT_26488, partial [Blyttiomyces helicus]
MGWGQRLRKRKREGRGDSRRRGEGALEVEGEGRERHTQNSVNPRPVTDDPQPRPKDPRDLTRKKRTAARANGAPKGAKHQHKGTRPLTTLSLTGLSRQTGEVPGARVQGGQATVCPPRSTTAARLLRRRSESWSLAFCGGDGKDLFGAGVVLLAASDFEALGRVRVEVFEGDGEASCEELRGGCTRIKMSTCLSLHIPPLPPNHQNPGNPAFMSPSSLRAPLIPPRPPEKNDLKISSAELSVKPRPPPGPPEKKLNVAQRGNRRNHSASALTDAEPPADRPSPAASDPIPVGSDGVPQVARTSHLHPPRETRLNRGCKGDNRRQFRQEPDGGTRTGERPAGGKAAEVKRRDVETVVGEGGRSRELKELGGGGGGGERQVDLGQLR